MGCYGWKKANTPHIDALAKEGILLEKAYSQSPLTLPSHSTLFTGTSPIFHGIKDNSFFRLPSSIPTLASILQKRGYQTGAVVSGATLARNKGLDQGFSEYDDVPDDTESYLGDHSFLSERVAEKSIQAAQKQLLRFWDHPHRPFFFWLHLFDPHAEYRPPSPFREQFSSSPYDGEIAYTDFCLGKLLSFLKKHDKIKNTLIVLTADHGEGLGEHGEASHGYFLYNTTLHVPLIFKASNLLPQGKKICTPVSSMDVFPTVLSLLGIQERGKSQGKDFSSYLFNKKSQQKEFTSYAETYFPYHSFGWRVLRSFIKGKYKYINTRKGELYDLQTDPKETQNLLEQENLPASLLETASEIKQLLYLYRQNSSQSNTTQETKEHLERLESLSYIGYPGPNSSDARENKGPDPMEKKEAIALFIKAQSFMMAKKNKQALLLLEKILAQDPGNITSWALSGKLYGLEGNLDRALICYQKFYELRPELLAPQKAILDILIQQKKYEEAEKKIEAFLENNILEDAHLFSSLAYLKLRKEKWEQAESWAKKAILYNSNLPGSWYYLAMARKSSKKFAQAIRDFEYALRLKSNWPEAYYHYAICLIEEGYIAKAKEALRKGILCSQDAWKEKLEKILEEVKVLEKNSLHQKKSFD